MPRGGAHLDMSRPDILAPVRRMSTSLQSLKHGLSNSQPHMKLNYDVLERVMVFLAPWELLQMMQTCRTIRRLAIPILLRGVYIIGPPQILPMCYDLYRYHFLKDPLRFSWVTHLVCPYGMVDNKPEASRYSYPMRYRYTDFLQYLTNIQFLDLTMDGEDLNPVAYDWIMSLRRLRALKFREMGAHPTRITDLLWHHNARLEIVHMDQPRLHDGEVLDPLPILQRYAPSLDGLLIEAHSTHTGPMIPRNGPPFPAIVDLIWTSSQWVDSGLLATTFPALRRFTFEIVSLKWEAFGVPMTDNQALDHRSRNHAAQERSHWESLERIQGDLLSLWTLALRCRVDKIDTKILSEREGRIGTKIGHLVVLLHDTRPRHLVITVRPSFVQQMDRVLSFPSLQVLELSIMVYGEPDIIGTLQKAVNGVYKSNLRKFTVDVTNGYELVRNRILFPFPARGYRLI
ncbi:uncharacterized protein PHACADRAFT_257320, partial [Phanerochaete carnosa HHB-10118-sp]